MDYTDNELLEQARQFNTGALGLIYDRYSTALYRYAYRQVGDSQTAEDCVAETFTRFLAALKNNKGPRDHLRAYLYRIAHNLISDQFRRRSPVLDGLDEREDLAEDTQKSVEKIVQQGFLAENIRKHLAELTDDQRQVIVLKHLEDMDNAEVAEIMGKTVGSVKALNSRALNNLRKVMQAGKE